MCKTRCSSLYLSECTRSLLELELNFSKKKEDKNYDCKK